jgi:hypothetical protein
MVGGFGLFLGVGFRWRPAPPCKQWANLLSLIVSYVMDSVMALTSIQ